MGIAAFLLDVLVVAIPVAKALEEVVALHASSHASCCIFTAITCEMKERWF
jgi:hypothetical protein